MGAPSLCERAANITDSGDSFAHTRNYREPGCRESSDGTLPGHPEGLCAQLWQQFEEHRPSEEQERSYMQAHRDRDEFRHAERFALEWPRFTSAGGGGGGVAPLTPAAVTRPSATPSPSPVPSAAPPLGYHYFFFGGPGGTTC